MYIMKDKKISPMLEIHDDFHFPEQIKTTVGSLKHPKQWRLLELLISNDSRLPYTQLRKSLNIDENGKGDLNYHLNELEKNGWITNESDTDSSFDDRYSSYYVITKFGLKLIEGIMKSISRPSAKSEKISTLNATILENWVSAKYFESRFGNELEKSSNTSKIFVSYGQSKDSINLSENKLANFFNVVSPVNIAHDNINNFQYPSLTKSLQQKNISKA